MPPTGRPGSMPAKRCTACLASARIIAWSPFISADISIWASSSGVSESIDPPWVALPSPWRICSCISRHISSRSVVAVGDLVLGPAQAEVDLEHGLEGPPVGVVLHHRGAEGVLERLTVLDGDVLHRLHRVEVLGERHREPRVAEFGDEAGEQIEHGADRRLLVDATVPWPPWRCRSGTSAGCGGSPWPAGRRCSRCRAAPGCAPSRWSR